MNAFNLLPTRRRKRGMGLDVSAPFLGLVGALAVILIAAVVYVSADNHANSRQAELNQLSPGVAQWTAVAAGWLAFTNQAQQRSEELADVRQLAAARFNWSNLLGQLAVLMPADAQLSSLQVTAPSPASSAATGTSSTSAIQLSACATSQSAVAQTMVQLRRISQISSVTLSSSTDSGSTDASSGASSSTGSTGAACSLPVQFQLSLAFAATTSTATTSSAVSPAASATTTTSTP